MFETNDSVGNGRSDYRVFTVTKTVLGGFYFRYLKEDGTYGEMRVDKEGKEYYDTEKQNTWQPIKDLSKDVISDCTQLLFDDGSTCLYGNEDWPFAEVTHFKN